MRICSFKLPISMFFSAIASDSKKKLDRFLIIYKPALENRLDRSEGARKRSTDDSSTDLGVLLRLLSRLSRLFELENNLINIHFNPCEQSDQ